MTIRMAQARKLDLDDTTIQIARRMLSTPPKPHDEMKIGKARKPTKHKARPKISKNRKNA